ncbi:MAG TPA: sigma 54-interacting transcriptional regulator [Bacteroidota bacterium]|nr:sigma 54-interacting transcriptional regulator [Bacteroidota bacterium]
MKKPTTLGELQDSGYEVLGVKDELRKNLIAMMQKGEQLFPGIIGYEESVIPSIINAILAKHDIILLGLRGQAKTRLVRALPSLLDEEIPIIKGSEVNDNPFAPVSKFGVDQVAMCGATTPIEWIPRSARFSEKLATPDVTIADIIGDIDPIKAATMRLHFSHEGAIHFGLIPRSNRGIFAINELPDLQPRIQVGLLNILEEKDVQIRGFNVRIPLDVMLVFTANPEDYTNRGSIITPLKDRIDSQILTHYPRTVKDAISITEQEAWTVRHGKEVIIPHYFKEIIEFIAIEARKSEYVDQKSGVSARMTIAAMENLVSNAERRALMLGDATIMPRICDLPHVLPGLTGKVELVFEGEQEGATKVGRSLIGKAVREVFKHYFPDPLQKRQRTQSGHDDSEYAKIISWFESGNTLEVSDALPLYSYISELERVKGLRDLTKKYLKLENSSKEELASAMEFVLDGLHQNSKIAKDENTGTTVYKDMVSSIFTGRSGSTVEEFE